MNNRFHDAISCTTLAELVHDVIKNMTPIHYLLPNLFLVPIEQIGLKSGIKQLMIVFNVLYQSIFYSNPKLHNFQIEPREN